MPSFSSSSFPCAPSPERTLGTGVTEGVAPKAEHLSQLRTAGQCVAYLVAVPAGDLISSHHRRYSYRRLSSMRKGPPPPPFLLLRPIVLSDGLLEEAIEHLEEALSGTGMAGVEALSKGARETLKGSLEELILKSSLVAVDGRLLLDEDRQVEERFEGLNVKVVAISICSHPLVCGNLGD